MYFWMIKLPFPLACLFWISAKKSERSACTDMPYPLFEFYPGLMIQRLCDLVCYLLFWIWS